MNSFLNKFSRLSSSEKMIFGGALLTLISLVLPWYKDLDAWGKGDVFFGVTGPLSMMGYVIVLLSGAVSVMMVGRMLDKPVSILEKIPNLALRAAYLQGLLIFLTASIYFDSKFGVNVTLKETSIGIFLCLVGTVILAVGSRMKYVEPVQKSEVVFDEIESRIDRMHREIEKRESIDDVTLAEKQYREMYAEDQSVR